MAQFARLASKKGYNAMCLKCRSTRLMIRRLTGLERIAAFFTQKRKYLCGDCGFSFRVTDRRRDRREGDQFAVISGSGTLRP